MAIAQEVEDRTFASEVPARLDRLPWGGWHWSVVIALGITWIIDGLEVTLFGSISAVLKHKESLSLTEEQIGQLVTAYVVGAVAGALVFGYLTDRFGRKRLFLFTLGLYLTAAFLSAFSWDFWSFAVFRFFTGAGIGGEYSAINSAVDELIPARVRGRVDLGINGSYWVGAAAGALATMFLLDPRYFRPDLGWRLGFGIGAVLGLVILIYRNRIPESPRWLLTHGEEEEAERVVTEIEHQFKAEGHVLSPSEGSITIRRHASIGFGTIAEIVLRKYKARSALGLALMVAQAFLYNGVFFTAALILHEFHGVPVDRTGLYLVPFALGNFLGPLLLGGLFDTVGRKPMIAATYSVSAALLVVTGYLFARGMLTANTQVLLWTLIFFVASAASSSAYLTVSEVFPLELRGMAIALFFAVGTILGGSTAPWLFGYLIQTKSAWNIFYGYLLSAMLMLVAVVVTALFGVKAEGASLEQVAEPLSAAQGYGASSSSSAAELMQ
jgi:MFS family permease